MLFSLSGTRGGWGRVLTALVFCSTAMIGVLVAASAPAAASAPTAASASAAASFRCYNLSCDGLSPHGQVGTFTPCDSDDFIARDVPIPNDRGWNVHLEVHRSPGCSAQWTEVAVYYGSTNCAGDPCLNLAEAGRPAGPARPRAYVFNASGSRPGSVRQYSELIGARGVKISHKGCFDDTSGGQVCAFVAY